MSRAISPLLKYIYYIYIYPPKCISPPSFLVEYSRTTQICIDFNKADLKLDPNIF